MKKNNNLIGFILFLLLCILLVQPLMLFSQQKENHDRSKQLIERYNKLRNSRSLPSINRDSVIDDVTNEILLDKKYRKSTNEYNEDSIRYLFFNKGVMDYKYEIKEMLDKDTNAVFSSFLLADSSPNIRLGYSKQGNKNLLMKTKSYLKYDFGEVYVPQVTQERSKNALQKEKLKIKIDSVLYYVKWIIPKKYYYHYSNHIPLSSESIGIDTMYEIKKSVKKNPFTDGSDDTSHNMVLRSIHPDMYLILTNNKKEIMAILK